MTDYDEDYTGSEAGISGKRPFWPTLEHRTPGAPGHRPDTLAAPV
jgi:hypothetical protein